MEIKLVAVIVNTDRHKVEELHKVVDTPYCPRIGEHIRITEETSLKVEDVEHNFGIGTIRVKTRHMIGGEISLRNILQIMVNYGWRKQ